MASKKKSVRKKKSVPARKELAITYHPYDRKIDEALDGLVGAECTSSGITLSSNVRDVVYSFPTIERAINAMRRVLNSDVFKKDRYCMEVAVSVVRERP